MTALTLSRHRHRLLAECLGARTVPLAQSARFTVYALDPDRPVGAGAADLDDIVLVHDFARSEIDNNIARAVAEELLPLLAQCGLGRTGRSVQAVFERFVGAIVRSVDGDERRAWRLFYDNTLTALQRAGDCAGDAGADPTAAPDYIADFGAIYRRVADLVAEVAPETVLDVATCFGFLPMLLAAGGWSADHKTADIHTIVACDFNPALVSLAEDVARYRQLPGARFVHADILAAERASALAPAYDVVTAIHLLEHLEPAQTGPAMDALWSRTGRRLIVAVPIEAVPDERFGHRQVFDKARLAALSRRIHGVSRSFENRGAWLVIDRKDDGARKDGLEDRIDSGRDPA